MSFFGWSERPEVFVEPGARTSLVLGAVGVVLAVLGLCV